MEFFKEFSIEFSIEFSWNSDGCSNCTIDSGYQCNQIDSISYCFNCGNGIRDSAMVEECNIEFIWNYQ